MENDPAVQLQYRRGDATDPVLDPQGQGILLAHVCNDQGGWGRGFSGALSQRFAAAETTYRCWAAGRLPGAPAFELGQVLFVPVTPAITVAHLLAQHGYRAARHPVPLDYAALSQALHRLALEAQRRASMVHMPRIGAGLGGGDWTRIAALIEQHLCRQGVAVWVYLPA